MFHMDEIHIFYSMRDMRHINLPRRRTRKQHLPLFHLCHLSITSVLMQVCPSPRCRSHYSSMQMPGKSFSCSVGLQCAIYCPLCDVANSRETVRTIVSAYWLSNTFKRCARYARTVADVVIIQHYANRNAPMLKQIFLYALCPSFLRHWHA